MKPFYLIAASALALTTTACGNGPPKARAALDCPATSGDLTRTSIAPDHKTCTYVSSEGAEVTLQLVNVQGGPDATLKAIETNLLAEQPPPAAKAEDGKDVAKAGEKAEAEAKAEAKATAASAQTAAKDAADAEREAASDAAASAKADSAAAGAEKGKGGRTVVAHGAVIVDDDNGTTHVNLPGIRIDADDANDSARVDIGPIHVNAGEHGMTFHNYRQVRLRGEPLAREKRGLRATFISERKDLPEGYRFVGYEAGGPRVGPLTVAVVKAKDEIDQGDDIYKAVRKLVRDNGGV